MGVFSDQFQIQTSRYFDGEQRGAWNWCILSDMTSERDKKHTVIITIRSTINDKQLCLTRVTRDSLTETDKPVALEFPIELEFRNADLNPRSKDDQQQTQPTYDAGSGNRTRDTLVGGARSHHCATPDP